MKLPKMGRSALMFSQDMSRAGVHKDFKDKPIEKEKKQLFMPTIICSNK
jgi:hypothetical protein